MIKIKENKFVQYPIVGTLPDSDTGFMVMGFKTDGKLYSRSGVTEKEIGGDLTNYYTKSEVYNTGQTYSVNQVDNNFLSANTSASDLGGIEGYISDTQVAFGSGTTLTGGSYINWYHDKNILKTNYIVLPQEYDNGNSGSGKTINWNNGQNQKITLTNDCTLTFTDINLSSITARIQLKVIQDGVGYRNLLFPLNVKFPKDQSFVIDDPNRESILTFYWDGTNYYVIQTNF